MKKWLMAVTAFLVLTAGISAGHTYIRGASGVKQTQAEKGRTSRESGLKTIQVKKIGSQRVSDREIKIQWSGKDAPHVKKYIIKRKRIGRGRWRTLRTLIPDGAASRRTFSYVDTLKDSSLQQYEYRIDVKVKDDTEYKPVKGSSVRAGNILLCIDPGHYEGQNMVNEEGTAYAEGDFTLKLAKELKKILEKTYGIASYMTRETGTITLGGYTNGELDNSHISLRGEYAEGSDLFLSLHTNANLDGANGYGTYDQPVGITKPIVIANTTACDSALALAVGNAVGERLAEASARMGIAVPGRFQRAEDLQDMVPWTDAFNDSLEGPGTVCYRFGEYGGDYYGVLRGAAAVGVPGMIVEHGFHTVPEMRQMAAQGKLETQWAKADAEGIAGGIESVLWKLRE